MTKIILFLLISLLLSGCGSPAAAQDPAAVNTLPTTAAAEHTVVCTEPEITAPPVPVLELTDSEKTMLLKISMAERGTTECTECMALVMRTILNRVETGRFGNSIQSVLFAQDQFTPVADGSYYQAEPSERCLEALDMVISGWDESQGALYYEWCQGESWHSKNLHLLFQHCDSRFYD